jgi:glutaconate CoA-transferase subunit A
VLHPGEERVPVPAHGIPRLVEVVVPLGESGAVVLPGWVVTAVAEVPGGAHPSYAAGFSERDNDFYEAWDAVSRDRDTFLAWMEHHVMGGVAA